MFFEWNVESSDRKFSSVIVSSLCRTKYPLLWWIQKISKITTNVLKEPAKKHHRSLINEKRSSWPCNDQVGGTYIKRTCYSVKSSDLTELKKKENVIDFGNEQRYCSCTCPYFKNNRMICKHFFVVIEGNHRTFNDISQLFRDHVWINLGSKLFTSSSLTKIHLKSRNNTESQTNTMLNQEKGMFDECKDISNSPPNRVYNETLKIHQTASDHYK